MTVVSVSQSNLVFWEIRCGAPWWKEGCQSNKLFEWQTPYFGNVINTIKRFCLALDVSSRLEFCNGLIFEFLWVNHVLNRLQQDLLKRKKAVSLCDLQKPYCIKEKYICTCICISDFIAMILSNKTPFLIHNY